MKHRILHITAVLFTALAASLLLSRLGHGNHIYFSQNRTEAVYSEVLNDFIVSHIEHTTEGERIQAYTIYCDSRGNRYDRDAVDTLCPLNNATILAFENRFPTAINGRPVTAREAEAAVFRHRVAKSTLDYGLYDLIDSHSYLSQKFDTKDLMRFTPEGIEFILPEEGRIDAEKTATFNEALKAVGFVAPLTAIWSPSTRTDVEQQGFFLNDSRGRLFRLSMTEGVPVTEELARPDDKEVAVMSFCEEEDYLAMVITTDGNSYLYPRDRKSYARLPLPSLTDKSISLSANLFYYTFTLEGTDSVHYMVIDKTLQPVAQYAVEMSRPATRFDISRYIAPLRIGQSPYRGIDLQLGDIVCFWWVNLLLALITFAVRRRRKYNLDAQLTDTLIVALLGLCGMIGVFAIPYRRNDKKENYRS